MRILIGKNCAEALEPVKVINSENGGLLLSKQYLNGVL